MPDSHVTTGYTRDFSFVMGSNFADDRGNATFYATYRDVDAVLQKDCDYSACSFNSGDVFTCGGSSTTDPTRMQVRNPLTGALANNVILDSSTGGLRPYAGATDAYNFGPLNFYQRPDERYTAGLFMDMNVGESRSIYSEFMFMKDRSVSHLTGSMTLADRYTLRLGVNNLLDKDPPPNGSTSCPTGPCNGNTWPQVYDAMGRQIFGLVTVDF